MTEQQRRDAITYGPLLIALIIAIVLGCSGEQTNPPDPLRQAAYGPCDQAPVNGPWLPDGSCQAALGKQLGWIGVCCGVYCGGQPMCENGCLTYNGDDVIAALQQCPQADALADDGDGPGKGE